MPNPTPKTRWYHLTPDRFFVGLLAVQVFLFLSERFQWFPFNDHKGWTVLIAIGVVGVAVVVMLFWGVVCLLLRRRFQFGVRSMLVFLVAVSVPLGWFAWEMQRARRQREAVEAIWHACDSGVEFVSGIDTDGLGRNRTFKYGNPYPAPALLQALLGEEFFTDIVYTKFYVPAGLEHLHGLARLEEVDMNQAAISDAELKRLGRLHGLLALNLSRSPVSDTESRITNAGLEHLNGLARLRELDLSHTKIGDAGLLHLRSLSRLERLHLAETAVTDAGLPHLRNLTQLEVLDLSETRITGSGLMHLRRLTRLKRLWLSSTQVTDCDLQYLEALKQLSDLDLCYSQVTDAGLVNLQRLASLEMLYLGYTRITDVGTEHLQEMRQLRRLDLRSTEVTDVGLAHLEGLTRLERLQLAQWDTYTEEGVKKLQEALPNCHITY